MISAAPAAQVSETKISKIIWKYLLVSGTGRSWKSIYYESGALVLKNFVVIVMYFLNPIYCMGLGWETEWTPRQDIVEQLAEKYPEESESSAVEFINELFEDQYLKSKPGSEEVDMSPLGKNKLNESLQGDPMGQIKLFEHILQESDSVEDLFGRIASANKHHDINILRTAYIVNDIARAFGDYDYPFPESLEQEDLRLFDPDIIPDPDAEDPEWPNESVLEEAGEPPEYLAERFEEEDSIDWSGRLVILALIRRISPHAFSEDYQKKALGGSEQEKYILSELSIQVARKSGRNIFKMIDTHRDFIEEHFDVELVSFPQSTIDKIEKVAEKHQESD